MRGLFSSINKKIFCIKNGFNPNGDTFGKPCDTFGKTFSKYNDSLTVKDLGATLQRSTLVSTSTYKVKSHTKTIYIEIKPLNHYLYSFKSYLAYTDDW